MIFISLLALDEISRRRRWRIYGTNGISATISNTIAQEHAQVKLEKKPSNAKSDKISRSSDFSCEAHCNATIFFVSVSL